MVYNAASSSPFGKRASATKFNIVGVSANGERALWNGKIVAPVGSGGY
jgi:hypothetical protein